MPSKESSAAYTTPQADPVPPTFRERIRNQLPADVARQFDELCEWEDDILKALNMATTAADRMAVALELIVRMTRVADPEVHEIAKVALFPKEAA